MATIGWNCSLKWGMCSPVSHSPHLIHVDHFCYLPGPASNWVQNLYIKSPTLYFVNENTKPSTSPWWKLKDPESWPVLRCGSDFWLCCLWEVGILPGWDPTSTLEDNDLEPPSIHSELRAPWMISNLCFWFWGCHLLRCTYTEINSTHWDSTNSSTQWEQQQGLIYRIIWGLN